MLGLAKTIGKILAVIIGVLIALMIAGFALTFCCDPIPEPTPVPIPEPTREPTSGIVRNCIKSVLGNPPQCSDTLEVERETTCNGRDLDSITYSDAIELCR